MNIKIDDLLTFFVAILIILIIYCISITRELCGEVHQLNNSVRAYAAIQDSVVTTLNNSKMWIFKYENPDNIKLKKRTKIIFDE